MRAYSKHPRSKTDASIRIVDLARNVTRTALRRPPDRNDISDLAWAPDGNHLAIAFASGNGPGRDGVCVLDLATDKLTPLLRGDHFTSVSWSSDGQHIVADDNGYAAVLDLQTGRVHVLAPRDTSRPSYSPDGSKIAYATTRDRNGTIAYGEENTAPASELYVMDADGTHDRRVTTTRIRNESQPVWLDDHTLLYVHEDGLWRLNIATGQPQRIMKHRGFNNDLATAP